MTDLLQLLPSFPVRAFAPLITAIEAHALSTTDLLTTHPTDLAKQTRLPIIDLRRLLAAIQASLTDQLVATKTVIKEAHPPSTQLISTLDNGLDALLGGGIPTGHITELVGESGAGKTQLLLTLCLAVQLPPPHGLAKKALYISTESGLATRRLEQMRAFHPLLDHGPASLDNILSTVTPDLESQDHILEYQVPVLLAGGDIGLLVLDSVAANYRAEFERQGSIGSNMAARSAELIRLGALLRTFARKHGLAVVVANQVADRFPSSPPSSRPTRLKSQEENDAGLDSSAPPFSLFELQEPEPPPALRLDHQQRWFTGWGDDPEATSSLKTPSLGLVWSTQISCRIALFKRPSYGQPERSGPPVEADDLDARDDQNVSRLKSWRRWMKLVFAPHVKASGQGMQRAVEYDITMAGLKSIQPP